MIGVLRIIYLCGVFPSLKFQFMIGTLSVITCIHLWYFILACIIVPVHQFKLRVFLFHRFYLKYLNHGHITKHVKDFAVKVQLTH
jgi:hypothetical protein